MYVCIHTSNHSNTHKYTHTCTHAHSGEHRKPTVVWATSIVMGSVIRNNDPDQQLCMSAKLMQIIRESDVPTEKESVFTRAIDEFGIQGPITCHPYARKYDIFVSTFLHEDQGHFFFLIADPNNVSNTTKARLLCNERLLPKNIFPGDRLRLEVEFSSLHDVKLQIPADVDTGSISSVDRVKPVAILHLSTLGFVDTYTMKFRERPHAREFVHRLSQAYHVATIADEKGMTTRSRLFGIYPLLFECEDDNLRRWLDMYGLDSSNTFILHTHDKPIVSVRQSGISIISVEGYPGL